VSTRSGISCHSRSYRSSLWLYQHDWTTLSDRYGRTKIRASRPSIIKSSSSRWSISIRSHSHYLMPEKLIVRSGSSGSSESSIFPTISSW
jgi:hypothetical protein